MRTICSTDIINNYNNMCIYTSTFINIDYSNCVSTDFSSNITEDSSYSLTTDFKTDRYDN